MWSVNTVLPKRNQFLGEAVNSRPRTENVQVELGTESREAVKDLKGIPSTYNGTVWALTIMTKKIKHVEYINTQKIFLPTQPYWSALVSDGVLVCYFEDWYAKGRNGAFSCLSCIHYFSHYPNRSWRTALYRIPVNKCTWNDGIRQSPFRNAKEIIDIGRWSSDLDMHHDHQKILLKPRLWLSPQVFWFIR